jgi:predicted unusual protein kinase regulating ubiquinone biosynthesis (AarF/ABC1/UbiB family)
MVGHVSGRFQETLLRLLVAISEGQGDEAAQIAIRMGEAKPNFDKSDLSNPVANLVARHADTTLEQIDAGQVALEITRIAAETAGSLAVAVHHDCQALLKSRSGGLHTRADFDPNAIIREEASKLLPAK